MRVTSFHSHVPVSGGLPSEGTPSPRVHRRGVHRARAGVLALIATVAALGAVDRLASARDDAELSRRNGWIVVGEAPMKSQFEVASACAARLVTSAEVGKRMQAYVDAKPAEAERAAAEVVKWMSSEAGLAAAGYPKGSSIHVSVGERGRSEAVAQTPPIPGSTPGVAKEVDPLNCWWIEWRGRWIKICVGMHSGKTLYAPW